MKIAISKSLKPISHELGSSCIIPLTAWQCTVYPCKITLKSHMSHSSLDIDLKIQGPVKDFTLEQDLEEGRVRVFGLSNRGYFRYVLRQGKEGLALSLENAPLDQLHITVEGTNQILAKGDSILLSREIYPPMGISKEKLCLGQHKSQDWTGIRKRVDLSEIFPLWLRLGQRVAKGQPSKNLNGMMELLKKCQDAVTSKQRSYVKQEFTHLFLAGFSSMLSPRLFDDEYQGIVESLAEVKEQNALELLYAGSELIRSLFFQEIDDVYHLLPCLPPQFVCGRFTHISTLSGDRIDIQWSKGWIRSVIIHVGSSKMIQLILQKEIKSLRMKKDKKAKGTSLSIDQPIACSAGDIVYLDRFER